MDLFVFKRLIRTVYLQAILMLVTIIGGCSSDNSDALVPRIEMMFHETTQTFSANGGSSQILFTSTVDWSADVTDVSGNSNWCSISPKSGSAGTVVMSLTAEPNTSYDERRASVVIKADTVSRAFTVVQKQKDAILLTSDKVEVRSEGGNITVDVQSNINYECKIDDAAKSWISKASTRGLSTNKEVFNVSANTSTTKREAKITFYSEENSETVTVYQEGEEPAIVLTKNQYEVASDGGDITVEIQSNVNYEYGIDDAAKSWISRVSTRGLTTNKEVFRISANTSTVKRDGKITFVSGNIAETVTIYQAGEGASLVISKNKYEVGADGETIQIELKSNVDYKMQLPSVDWISEAKTRTMSAYTHHIVVKPNETYNERSAEIIFVNNENKLSERVTIVQKQKNALKVKQDKVDVACTGGDVTIEVQGNVDYQCNIDDAAKSWISKVSTRGLTTNKEVFRISVNTTPKSRDGRIIFTDGNLSDTVTVHQDGETPYLMISQNRYEVGTDGGIIRIELSSNVDYEMQLPSVNWISVAKTRTVSSYAHNIVVGANETYYGRNAEIVFFNKEYNLSGKVYVIQKQRDFLSVASNKVEVGSSGGNITIEVQSNIDYECIIDDAAKSWISKVSTSGLTSYKEIFSVSGSISTENRSGKITFKGKNISTVVTVTQKGIPSGNNVTDIPSQDW